MAEVATRVRAVYKRAEYQFGQEITPEVVEEGELLNVFWHPIDGLCVAYVSEFGEISAVKMAEAQVLEGE